ncbi:AsmA family protein [Pelagibius litoralis]|uniref:AsmA family protein n=1 Tax=Pelagibius litoralis TaxID=374515 RepID=A0A967F344_9PROT|nr:AsmA family protein [Pelagibius litoralis]NIA72124.1 AsmA family protein [Pelagibius litoralis]
MRLRRVLYWSVAVVTGIVVAGYAALSSLQFDDLTTLLQGEVKRATGRDLVIAGPVDLQISFSPSVDLQDIRFANASWGSRAEMATISRLEVEVELLPLLTGDIVVNRLVLVDPDILLETDAEGRGNWEFETAASGAADQGTETAGKDSGGGLPDIQAFAVQGGRLTVKGATPEEQLRVDLTEASGLVPEGGAARSLMVAGRYNDSPFRVEGTFGSLRAVLSGDASPLDLAVEAGGAKGTIKGTAGDLVGAARAKLAVTAQGDSLAALTPLAGTEIPNLGPYKLTSDVNINGNLIDFSGLTAQVGGSDLAGAGTLDLSGKRPVVTADLAAKTLDMADFAPPTESSAPNDQEKAEQSGEKGGRIFSKEPLALDGLAALDGELALSAGELRATPRVILNDVKLSAHLKEGRLQVEPMQAVLAGGTLTGRGSLDARREPAVVDLVLQGEGMDFGELLQAAEISDRVGGPLALDVALSGKGGSAHALASSLDGHVQAVSQDGTIDNALLSFFSAGLSNITGPLFGTADQANLDCIIGRFDIVAGQAKSRALVMDTGTFAIAGRGGIDLEAERVSLTFDTETSEPSLASLAVPFKVIGPMEDPSIVPDAIGAAVNVVGTVGTVAETSGNIVAGAVDTLGGLVGTGPLIGKIGGDQTLCGEALTAIGLAQSGPANSDPANSEVQPAGGAAPGQATEEPSPTGVIEDIGEGLKNLFGN